MDKPNKQKQPSLEKQYKQERKKAQQRIEKLKDVGLDITDDILPPVPKQITPASVQRLKGFTTDKIVQKAKKQTKQNTPKTANIETNAPRVTRASKPKSTSNKQGSTTKSKPKSHTRATHKKPTASTKPKSQNTEYQNEETFAPPTTQIPSRDSNLNLDIVNHLSNMLENFDASVLRTQYLREKNTRNHMVIFPMWSDVLLSEGEYEVAYRLEGKAKELNDIVEALLYGSNSPEVDNINIARFMELILGRKMTSTEAQQIDELQYQANINTLGGL